MTNEEKIQQRMEFIIEQQAHFASDIHRLSEAQAKTENYLGQLVSMTTAGFTELIERVTAIADSQIQMQDSLLKLAEAQRHTEAQFAETNERLNTLIDVVERHISEGHSGKSQT